MFTSTLVHRPLDPSEEPSEIVDFWGKTRVSETQCAKCNTVDSFHGLGSNEVYTEAKCYQSRSGRYP